MLIGGEFEFERQSAEASLHGKGQQDKRDRRGTSPCLADTLTAACR
jgi:hypothetical protein